MERGKCCKAVILEKEMFWSWKLVKESREISFREEMEVNPPTDVEGPRTESEWQLTVNNVNPAPIWAQGRGGPGGRSCYCRMAPVFMFHF